MNWDLILSRSYNRLELSTTGFEYSCLLHKNFPDRRWLLVETTRDYFSFVEQVVA